MRKNLLEKVEIICPCCRHGSSEGVVQAPLKLDRILRSKDDFVLEGFFVCSNTECGCEYPILNGVPVVLKDIKGWWHLEKSSLSLIASETPAMREYFAGLSYSDFSSYKERSLISLYMDLHYGAEGDSTNNFTSWADPHMFWEKAVGIAKPEADQISYRSLDLGCSVGRYTFELARFSDLAVGIDLKFSVISKAAMFQRSKEVAYERRKHGRCFELVETSYSPSQNVFFLVADALDPPFRAETFDLVAALNLVDNVKLPLVLIGQMDALLKKGGNLVLGSPYEWQADICEPEEWLETDDMDSPEMLLNMLEGKLIPQMGLNYIILENIADVPWLMRHHVRHYSVFLVHLLKATKRVVKI